MESVRPLSTELALKAQNELNEVPARIPADVEALRVWIAKQPHLKTRTDDQFLVSFLRGSKYSLEKAKEKIDNFCTVKSAVPDFFSNRDPELSLIQEIVDLGVNLPLPYTTEPDAPKFVLVRMGAYDPSKVSIMDIMKVCFMKQDILLNTCDTSIIAGHIVLVDMSGITLATFSQFSPANLKKMTTVIEAYPIRTKGIHFINPITGFEPLFRLFKGFLNTKTQSRMFVHENFDDLHQKIPKKFLPEEYGGSAGKLQDIITDWKIQLLENKRFFKEDSEYGTDERKRVGKPKNAMELFGVDGSFRALGFD